MPLEINPALDIAYLERVYGDDANIIYLIFDAFLSDCLPRWVVLKSLLDEQDLAESASLIHGLKPAFTMSGMSKVKKKVEQLELLVKSKAEKEVQIALYDEIDTELEFLVPILRAEAARLQSM